MQGNFIVELQKYVTDRFGSDAWKNSLTEAGIKPNKIYFRLNSYPDDEIAAILAAACKVTSASSAQLLEDFGYFLGQEFMHVYANMLLPSWRTLDVIANTDFLMQEALKNLTSKVAPPKLSVVRQENELHINYYSPRKMCPVGVGIIKSVAKHFNEEVSITHTSCMLQGDFECNLVVQMVHKDSPVTTTASSHH